MTSTLTSITLLITGIVLGLLLNRLFGKTFRQVRALKEEIRMLQSLQEQYKRSVSRHLQKNSKVLSDAAMAIQALQSIHTEGIAALGAVDDVEASSDTKQDFLHLTETKDYQQQHD